MKQKNKEERQQYRKYLENKLAQKTIENNKLKYKNSNLKNRNDTLTRLNNALSDSEKRTLNNINVLYLQLEKTTKQVEAYRCALNVIREIVDTNCKRDTKSLIECIRNLVENSKPKEE